jgi:hypothetical protein
MVISIARQSTRPVNCECRRDIRKDVQPVSIFDYAGVDLLDEIIAARSVPYDRWVFFDDAVKNGGYPEHTINKRLKLYPELVEIRIRDGRRQVYITHENARIFYYAAREERRKSKEEIPMKAVPYDIILKTSGVPEAFIKTHFSWLGEELVDRTGIRGYAPHRVQYIQLRYQQEIRKITNSGQHDAAE